MSISVLTVYRTYYPNQIGGILEAIRQLCLSSRAHGVQNTIFTLSSQPLPRRIMLPEAEVIRCRTLAAPASCDLGGWDAFAEFRRLARKADVVHYFFPWPFADMLHALVCPAGTPVVLTYVSDIVRQQWLNAAYAPLMWRTLRSMNAIIANSPAYAATSSVLTDPSIRAKVSVIPFGIDETSYPQASDDSVLGRLGLVDGEPYFLFIGVLRYYKGLHTLIEAARKVAAKVVIVGSGPKSDELRAQSAKLGLRNIVFSDHVTDGEKVALLKGCRAFVLPSHLRSEAYGMVLVEAAMFGRPMISCQIGTGTSFINNNGETGYVVPPEAPHALAAAMNRLLTDEALGERFGQAARSRYERMFSGEVMGLAYADLYRKVTGK